MDRVAAKTVGDAFDETSSLYASDEMMIFQNRKIKYREMQHEVNSFAKSLLKLGIKKGQKVAVLMTNRPEWVVSKIAIAKIGAVMVPINTRLKEVDIEYILKQSDTNALILMDQFKKVDFLAMIQSICPDINDYRPGKLKLEKFPKLSHVICHGSRKFSSSFDFMELVNSGKYISDNELVKAQSSLSPGDTVNIVYTSGTTAFPKGVMLSHENILRTAYNLGIRVQTRPGDRLCDPLPFYHTGGCVSGILHAIVHGACLITNETFDPEELLAVIEKERCSWMVALDTFFITMMGHSNFSKYDLRSLHKGTTTGSPETLRSISERFIPRIRAVYGLTEASPHVSLGGPDDPDDTISTCGKPLPGVDVKIIDKESGKDCSFGMEGEILVKGYNVMKGYYKKESETNKVMDKNGWLHTGDLGILRERGYLEFTGRLKNIIRVGGENLSPFEVEDFLLKHPKIRQVAVIGVPDDRLVEVPMAFVRLEEGAICSEEEILQYCKGKIAHFKIPKYVKFVHEFEMTGSGKITIFRLQELFKKEKN